MGLQENVVYILNQLSDFIEIDEFLEMYMLIFLNYEER